MKQENKQWWNDNRHHTNRHRMSTSATPALTWGMESQQVFKIPSQYYMMQSMTSFSKFRTQKLRDWLKQISNFVTDKIQSTCL